MWISECTKIWPGLGQTRMETGNTNNEGQSLVSVCPKRITRNMDFVWSNFRKRKKTKRLSVGKYMYVNVYINISSSHKILVHCDV